MLVPEDLLKAKHAIQGQACPSHLTPLLSKPPNVVPWMSLQAYSMHLQSSGTGPNMQQLSTRPKAPLYCQNSQRLRATVPRSRLDTTGDIWRTGFA